MVALEDLEKARRWRELPWKCHHKRPIREVAQAVKERVFGQDEHVDRILNFVYASLNRAELIKKGFDKELLPQLNSMLLIGPTASGKTHVVRTIAQQMDMVFFPIDVSTITGEGWKGQGLSSRWMNIAQMQKEDADSTFLVFLDEIDKLTIKDDNHSSFSPKFELLKPLESDTISFDDDKGITHVMDCNRCVFILAGAFTGIERVVAERLDDLDIANAVHDPHYKRSDHLAMGENELRSLVSLVDVESWGFPRELVGRFSFVDVLPPLGVQELMRIVADDLLPRYERMLPNAMVSISSDALDFMAEKSFAQNYGARNLSQQLSEVFLNLPLGGISASVSSTKICIELLGSKELYCSVCSDEGASDALKSQVSTEDVDLVQAQGHAQLLLEQIAAVDSALEPDVALIREPLRFMKVLLLDSQAKFGNYQDAEVLLLHSLLCLARDWFAKSSSSYETLEILIDFCVSSDSSFPHMQWDLDSLFQEIHSGVMVDSKKEQDGSIFNLAMSNMRRYAEGDPEMGISPAVIKGFSPSDDEALGTYCDFKAFSVPEQKRAIGSLKRRIDHFRARL